MAKEKVPPLSHRLYYDPAYVALARAIRYATVPCDELRQKLAAAEKEFGIPKLDAAARELLDYDHRDKVLVATLKPHVKKLAFGLLGPPQEEAADFYRNADGSWPLNTPPEVIEAAEKKPKRTKDEEPQTLPISPEEELEKRVPRETTPEEARVRKLSRPQLAERLQQARHSLQSNGPRSFLGKEARKEIRLLQAEFRRRKLSIPPETTPEPIRRKRGA